MPCLPRHACRAHLLATLLLVGLSAGPLVGCETGSLSSMGPALTDQSLTSAQVRTALAADPETANLTILVKTLDSGSVRLSGNVPNGAVRHRAEQIAGEVVGVAKVVNTLQIP